MVTDDNRRHRVMVVRDVATVPKEAMEEAAKVVAPVQSKGDKFKLLTLQKTREQYSDGQPGSSRLSTRHGG